MKKIFFKISAIFLILAGCFSCGQEKIEECQKIFSDNIVGRWKLTVVSVAVSNSLIDVTDYSKENIIFDFQENNKLVVTGPIPDVIVVFDDFQAGEHFYTFQSYNHDCGSVCDKPGPNLFIDKPEFASEERQYFCTIELDDETMQISKSQFCGAIVVDDGFEIKAYTWGKRFIRIK